MASRIRDGENAGQTAAGVSTLSPADATATLRAIRLGQLDGVVPAAVDLLRAAAQKAAQQAQRRRYVLRLPDGEDATAEWRTDDEGRFSWIWAGGAPRVDWVEVAL